MAATELAVQFARLYPDAIDKDFGMTTEQRMAYLSSPLRFPGQPVFDITEGLPYYLSNDKSKWLPFGSTEGGDKLLGKEFFTGAELDTNFSYQLSIVPEGNRYDVYVSGIQQEPDEFTLVYPLLTFPSEVPPEQKIWVESYKSITGGNGGGGTPPAGQPGAWSDSDIYNDNEVWID